MDEENYAREILNRSVACIAQNIGFTSAQKSTLQLLEEVTRRLLESLCRSTCPTDQPGPSDMDRDALFDRSLKSLDAAGIDLQSLWEYIRSVGSFTLPFEVPLFPVPVSALNKYQYEMERPDADPQDPAVISTALELKRGMKLACRTNRDFLPKSLPFNADLNYFDLEKDFNINVLMREGKLKSKAFPTFINKSASELRITTVDSDPDPSSDEVDEAEANTSIDSLATPIMNLRKPVKRKRHDTNRRIKKKKNRKLFHKQQQINNNNNLIRATPVPTREGIKQSSSRMRIRILRSLVNIPANDNINGTHQNTQKIQQEAADEPEEVIFPKRSLRDRRQQVDYRGCE